MKRFLSWSVIFCLMVSSVYAADKAIVYDDTNKKLKVSQPLPVAQGGTGSATQNFVDLSTIQNSIGGVKTFTSIPELPASDPTTDNQASRKAFVDGKFNTSSGHDHDGSDSKKVLQTNIDTTGGTSGQVYKANGTGGGSWGSAAGIPSNMQAFTSSGTWDWSDAGSPAKVYVKAWGGGGGGGANVGSGGGGGGYAEGLISVTGDVTVTIGSGGAGGLSIGPTLGGTGGTSSFVGSATIQATGGTGGNVQPAGGGSGGNGSGGTVNLNGQSGGRSSASYNIGGDGGSAPMAGSGGPGGNSSSGSAGVTPGGGGGGAGGSNNGGIGGVGMVIVYW